MFDTRYGGSAWVVVPACFGGRPHRQRRPVENVMQLPAQLPLRRKMEEGVVSSLRERDMKEVRVKHAEVPPHLGHTPRFGRRPPRGC